jgi:hypothetical protein
MAVARVQNRVIDSTRGLCSTCVRPEQTAPPLPAARAHRRSHRKLLPPRRQRAGARLCLLRGRDSSRNEETHARPADLAAGTATRGRVILNSVNSLGLVSTSIDPACCLTMISWLMESPRPVPSPAGLVVKKGLNSFSLTSGEMPVPLSRILISTRSSRFFVVAVSVGSYPSLLSCSLRFVAA